MRTHRFGQKIKLPATIAIKHQIRMRMAEYEIKKVEAEARAEAFRGQTDDNPSGNLNASNHVDDQLVRGARSDSA